MQTLEQIQAQRDHIAHEMINFFQEARQLAQLVKYAR